MPGAHNSAGVDFPAARPVDPQDLVHARGMEQSQWEPAGLFDSSESEQTESKDLLLFT